MMNHSVTGTEFAALLFDCPRVSANAEFSGFWELRFDSRNVPPAALTPAMAAEDRNIQFTLDMKAIRWCHFLGVPYVMEGADHRYSAKQNGKEILITTSLRIQRGTFIRMAAAT